LKDCDHSTAVEADQIPDAGKVETRHPIWSIHTAVYKVDEENGEYHSDLWQSLIKHSCVKDENEELYDVIEGSCVHSRALERGEIDEQILVP